ncbi:MAG: tyrosine-type recombinase/integrase [Methylobacter sp.]
MSNKITFTESRIKNLTIPATGRVDYHDIKCPKLTCRVSATGVKSFVVLKWNGKTMQRVTLGRFPDMTVIQAQDRARKALADLATGINPTEEKQKRNLQSITLIELLERYLSQKNLRPASILDYRKKAHQGFEDWLNKPVNSITRDMVLARHKKLDHGIDNKMRVLRLLMGYAMALKIITANPVDVLKDVGLWSKLKRRKRIISVDTLAAWYAAVLQLSNQKAKVYLLVLLYTGFRSSEALHMRWRDVDFKNDTLTVRDTKNHTDFTTFIPTQLKPYLRHLQGLTGDSSFVFPGGTANGVMDIPHKPIAQITKQTGVAFSSHDLRRTFATIAEAVLLPETLIKKLLNHETDNSTTGGYIHTESHTQKRSIDKIAAFIQDKVTPGAANVLSIKAAN